MFSRRSGANERLRVSLQKIALPETWWRQVLHQVLHQVLGKFTILKSCSGIRQNSFASSQCEFWRTPRRFPASHRSSRRTQTIRHRRFAYCELGKTVPSVAAGEGVTADCASNSNSPTSETACGQLHTKKNKASWHQRPTGCPRKNPAPFAAIKAAWVDRLAKLFTALRSPTVSDCTPEATFSV